MYAVEAERTITAAPSAASRLARSGRDRIGGMLPPARRTAYAPAEACVLRRFIDQAVIQACRERCGEPLAQGVGGAVQTSDRRALDCHAPTDGERSLRRLDDGDDVEAELGVRPRLLPGSDRRAEVGQLDQQRLARFDAWGDDVSRAIAQVVFAEALRPAKRRAGIEDPYGLVAHIVVHDHLARADDRRSPKLARRQPGELDVGDHAERELEVHERDVRRSGTDAI